MNQLRRGLALLFCLLLCVQLCLPEARADEPVVYFTAASENVLPLEDKTMPFWQNGCLYIPSTMFAGNVWRSLDIASYQTPNNQVILYSGGYSLIYELGSDYAVDATGEHRAPGTVQRNGILFVPAFMVASYFGLDYSVIPVPHGQLIWLRKPDFGLSDKYFADAATSNMESAYSKYIREKEREAQEKLPFPGYRPDHTAPGSSIYLCMKAGEKTAELLDALARQREHAAFFCTPDFLETQGNLLRRMAAEGHQIGILADGEASAVAEQLERGNRALEQATCGKTRLVYLEDAAKEDVRQAERKGYICLEPDLDRSGYNLKSASNADNLLRRIAARTGDVTVWLGDTADGFGLWKFLSAAEAAEEHCLSLTETVA